MIILQLTCSDDQEAGKIGKALLDARLVACVHISSVVAAYWWKGKIERDNETLLIMESIIEKFDQIDALVAKLHSYDQYVLLAIPVLKSSSGVDEWITQSVQG